MGKVKELMYGDTIKNVQQLRHILSSLDDCDQVTLVSCDEHGDEVDHYPMAIDVIDNIKLTDDTIVREVQFVQRPNCKPDTRDKQPLVDAIIKNIMFDYRKGDTTVIDELLKTIPWEILKHSLPEEEWAMYNTISRPDLINDFKTKWGQEEDSICAELGYEYGDDGVSELLMNDGYFWDNDSSLWFPRSSSLYDDNEQSIADHIRHNQ